MDFSHCGDNIEKWMDCIKLNYPSLIEHAPAKVKDERSVILYCVEKDGSMLQHASSRLRGDREIVRIAVQSCPSLQYASDELRADREIVSLAMDCWPSSFRWILGNELIDDDALVTCAVSYDGSLFKFSSERLRADRDLVLLALSNDMSHAGSEYPSIECASEDLKDDEEIALAALECDGRNFQYISERLRDQKDLALLATGLVESNFHFVSRRLQSDVEILTAAIDNDPNMLNCILEMYGTDTDITRSIESFQNGKETASASIAATAAAYCGDAPSHFPSIPHLPESEHFHSAGSPLDYCSCYCEENVYMLCKRLKSESVDKFFVVFVSSLGKCTPVWHQRAQKLEKREKGFPLLWDYHVFLIGPVEDSSSEESVKMSDMSASALVSSASACVYDLDTLLPFPMEVGSYLKEAFHYGPSKGYNDIKPSMKHIFRVIPASSYLSGFSSDRSHMKIVDEGGDRREDGSKPVSDQNAEIDNVIWQSEPPPWPVIRGPSADSSNNFSRYLDFTDASNNCESSILGRIMSIDEMATWCSR